MASSKKIFPFLMLFIIFDAFFVRGGRVGQKSSTETRPTDSCISKVLATCASSQLSTSVKEGVHEDSAIFEIQKTLSQMQVKTAKQGDTISRMLNDLKSLKKSGKDFNEETEPFKIKSVEDIKKMNMVFLLSDMAEMLLDKIDPHQNCADILASGKGTSGVQTVYPFCSCKRKSVTVFCDQSTDGRGWTVIQRRDNLTQREDFDRDWHEYVRGFGNISGEFWLGLDAIHALVSNTPMELRVDLEDFEGEKRWAKYEYFSIDDAANKYRLHIGGYSGDAGDALESHDGQYFTTKNKDHDQSPSMNCAQAYSGGWWFHECLEANLNGLPSKGIQKYRRKGIVWEQFRGVFYSLKASSMMVRPKA